MIMVAAAARGSERLSYLHHLGSSTDCEEDSGVLPVDLAEDLRNTRT